MNNNSLSAYTYRTEQCPFFSATGVPCPKFHVDFTPSDDSIQLLDDERVEFSDLPPEVLHTIGKFLDTCIDVLLFRSVCMLWRSSIHPFQFYSPSFPLKLPHPKSSAQPAYLCESTLYHLQRPNPSTSDEDMLINFEESYSNLSDPLSTRGNWYEFNSPDGLANNLNLLDFRVLKLTKFYTLKCQYRIGVDSYISIDENKVVKFPNPARTNVHDCAVVVDSHGKLSSAKFGDENWTLVDDANFDYDDIIVYKDRCLVVNRFGEVSELVRINDTLQSFGVSNSRKSVIENLNGSVRYQSITLDYRKYLVESCGALYVVDRYRGKEQGGDHAPKVYKLDEWIWFDIDVRRWHGRGYVNGAAPWEMVRSLGDRAFVLGNDCSFSVSAKNFSKYKGNCIYFNDQYETRVFNMEVCSYEDLEDFQAIHSAWPPSDLL